MAKRLRFDDDGCFDGCDGSSVEADSPAKRLRPSLCGKCDTMARRGDPRAAELLMFRCRACPRVDTEERAELLLEAGLDVDVRPHEGWSMLMHAASEGEADVCRLLLAHGASVDGADADGQTALMLAAWNGAADVVEVLLAHGATPAQKDGDRRTALMCASAMGHRAVCRMLLAASGASELRKKDSTGRTSAAWAEYMGFHLDDVLGASEPCAECFRS